jgi:putative NIF3 family GTP cyclohydrolase 1 type 2
MKIIAACILLLVFASSRQLRAQSVSTLSARQIVGEIRKNLTCKWNSETVDTFKTGNPDDVVTGVAVCMFADMQTLQKAVDQNCNLIIVHEPTFYSHLDKTDGLEDNPVYLKKKEFIDKHKLIIFRFHDHWHQTTPDGIYVGMIDKLGWKSNQTDMSMRFFRFDQQTVGGFAQKLREKLKTDQIRIVGDSEMHFTNVALAVGALGSQTHINLLRGEFTEVLVAGEASEWETYEYVLDASLLGMKKAAIFTGHIPSEEAGMEYCATWMKTFIKSVPVIYLDSTPSFQTIQNR